MSEMTRPKAMLYSEQIDFRLSPKKLAESLRWSGLKLTSGDLFIFFNRKRDRCKVIWHDGNDFCTVEKRLDRGRFAPNDKIKLTQDVIEKCIYEGIPGQIKLLHALMGNVVYLDDARKA